MKKLKRILTLCVLISISFAASAQLSWGVKAGFNASTISNIGEGDAVDASFRPGFHIGAAVQYMFTEQMGLESGLYYSTLGVNAEGKESGFKFESKMNPSYLQLPISFLYKFNVGPGLSLYPSVGMYFGYGLGGKVKDTYEYEGEKEEDKYDFFGKDDDGDALAKRFDMGVGVGLNLQVTKFTVGLGYDLGLTKINDFKADKDWKNGNIKVSVGYFF